MYTLPMRTIALIAQKGGAGKTTLALNLACAAAEAGDRPAIIDLDPQASACTWAQLRDTEWPAVSSAHAPQLVSALAAVREAGATVAFIDTAPHAEATALAAARAADLVLLPCRPGLFDVHAARASRDIASLAGTPAVAVLSATPPIGHLAAQARDALDSLDIETAPCTIAHRVAHIHAITAGCSVLEYDPAGKASAEIHALHGWLADRLPPTGSS